MSVRAARVVVPERDRAEIASAITDILSSGVLTLGPYTKAFEYAFGQAHQASNAVATSSGTAALEIALRALRVAGKDVIVPVNTFYATAAAVIGAGARPVFADIDAAAAFSFYPTKVVTCGEGGMILTASPELADEARIYRDQGKVSLDANHHVRHGYAWRMSEQNAATGLIHLGRMTESIARRREVARRYDAGLADLAALRALAEPAGCVSNFYKYVAVLNHGIDRRWCKEQLATRHDVRLSGEVYDLPLHMQPILKEYSLGQSLPVAQDLCDRHICLPVHSDMGDDEVDEVLAAVTEVAAQP